MKALRKGGRRGFGDLRQVAVPGIGRDGCAGARIGGVDLRDGSAYYGWDRWSQGRIKPPVTLGHEFCAAVDTVGEEFTAVKAGDFVSAEMHANCGHCHQCRLGEAHICQNLKIIGIDQDGAFAEFVKIPASNIWKLDAAIPERYGAILDPIGECGAYGFGRADRGTNGTGYRVWADRVDGDYGGEGLREFDGVR